MLIQTLKKMSFNEVRQHYIDWMNTQQLKQNTINTAKSDTFYILKHNPEFEFWEMIESEDFKSIARDILEKTLRKNSKGNVTANINGYIAHLTRFHHFAYSDTELTSVATVPKTSTSPRVSTRKSSVVIPTPTISEVQNYLSKWDTLENYRLQEEALDKLFKELSPKNNDLSDILIKTATLNDFYSTNIFSIYPVAKHILSLDIDERLSTADVTLVDDIKVVTIGGKTKNLYSFATKYCSHHNPLEYPIYDSYVHEVLCNFRNKDNFSSFRNADLKIYRSFKTIMIDFQAYYKLDSFNLKELDQFLWLVGKDYFPKNYK